jgi:hypothetical protein
MSIRIGRWASLGTLGAGLAIAAAFALSTANSALADASDGTGTSVITFNTKFLSHLASWGIAVIPENPATSSDAAGYDHFTFTVTGGNGSDSNFSGDVSLGGGLTFIDGITGAAVHFTSLELNYYNGDITGIPEGSTSPVAIADISGSLTSNNGTGEETFSASQLALDPQGAAFLNSALKSTSVGKRSGKTYSAFTAGTSTSGRNAFTITYAVTIS